MSQYAALTVYSCLTFWTISFCYLYRRQLSPMAGMMAAMALGMIIGLGIGTVIGVAFPHHFFEGTVISMLIGGVIGCIAGIPISLLAVIDGLLAGLMGGMMGTMVGVMLPASFYGAFIKIMGVFSATVFFILFLVLREGMSSAGHDKRLMKYFFHQPQLFFIVVGVFLLLMHQLNF